MDRRFRRVEVTIVFDLSVSQTSTSSADSSTSFRAPKDEGPHRRIAQDFRGAIVSGVLRPGEQLPTVVDLAARYSVSFGTAQRAIAQLRAAGLVSVSRGKRAVVVDPLASVDGEPAMVVGLHCRRRK